MCKCCGNSQWCPEVGDRRVGAQVVHEQDGQAVVLEVKADRSLVIKTVTGHVLHVNPCEVQPA